MTRQRRPSWVSRYTAGVRHGQVEGAVDLRLEHLEEQADEIAVAAHHEPAAVGVARAEQVECTHRASLGLAARLGARQREVRVRPGPLERLAPVRRRQIQLTAGAPAGRRADGSRAGARAPGARVSRASGRTATSTSPSAPTRSSSSASSVGRGAAGIGQRAVVVGEAGRAERDRLGMSDEQDVERGAGR